MYEASAIKQVCFVKEMYNYVHIMFYIMFYAYNITI